MKIRLVLLGCGLAATPAAAQGPDYEQLAQQSFINDDYATARRNLELALQGESDREKQVQLRRKLAAVYIFDGELSEAREIYAELIDEAAAARTPAAHDHYALATIGALQHKKHEVRKHLLAGDSINPRTPYAPMLHAIVWAHVGELDRVAEARAAMEGVADGQPQDTLARQAAALTRTIYAAKIRAFDVARAELAPITAPSMKAFAYVFLANAIRREGNRVAAEELDEEVRKFKEMSIYSAVAWRMIR